jgi:hypothetical protein
MLRLSIPLPYVLRIRELNKHRAASGGGTAVRRQLHSHRRVSAASSRAGAAPVRVTFTRPVPNPPRTLPYREVIELALNALAEARRSLGCLNLDLSVGFLKCG